MCHHRSAVEEAIAAGITQLIFVTSNTKRAIEDHFDTNYELEAKHCALYKWMLKDEDGVHVPQVIPELSTKRLLTTSWLDGEKILKFVDAHPDQRNRLAMNMFKAWYVPLYHYGIIHGDPHLGNYTVRDDDSINLLDFGIVLLQSTKIKFHSRLVFVLEILSQQVHGRCSDRGFVNG